MIPSTKFIAAKFKIIFLVLLTMTLSGIHAQANLTQTEVSMLYVSLFNRASEGEGNAFWGNRSDLQTRAEVAAAMLDTDAARNYFGASLNSNQDFIKHIYLNTLNKTVADDAAGIAFWVGQLDAGKTRGEVVSELVGVIEDYAPGGLYYNPNDPATIAAYNQFTNRVNVSNYMANTIQDPPANWQTATQFAPGGLNVTFEGTTVDTAKQAINLIAANAGGLADDIEFYMAMFSSAGELSPMMDEIGTLLEAVMLGDASVVTISPQLESIDLNNPPPNITITANFGGGYTPPDTTAVYTGLLLINITGISFTETGISANAALTASNVQRDSEPVLDGSMTFSINLGMTGDNTSVAANVSFSNLTSMGVQANGGITLDIPAISGEGQLVQPITLTLNSFSTPDYQLSGTVTMSQFTADTYNINLNVTTGKGQISGLLRVQANVQDPDQPDQVLITTPLGYLTIEGASVAVNNVFIDSDICEELPASGSIVVTRGAETSTINFSNCTYTIN